MAMQCTGCAPIVYTGVSVCTYAGCGMSVVVSGTIASSLEPFLPALSCWLVGATITPHSLGHPTLCPGPGGWLRVCVSQCHGWEMVLFMRSHQSTGLLHLVGSPC